MSTLRLLVALCLSGYYWSLCSPDVNKVEVGELEEGSEQVEDAVVCDQQRVSTFPGV